LAREQAICIDRLGADSPDHRMTTQQICEALKANGLFPDATNVIKEWEYETTVKILGRVNDAKFRTSDDKARLHVVNLFEKDDEGKKSNYYKKLNETTVEEAAQVANYWNKSEKHAWTQKFEVVSDAVSRFGREAVQELLDFDLPPGIGLGMIA
jgi:hypothetical protein